MDVFKRHKYERWVKPGATNSTWNTITFENDDVDSLVEWASFLKQKEEELGVKFKIDYPECGISGGIFAEYEVLTPVTEEQKLEAQEWLDANPKDPNATIKWRKLVPFEEPPSW